MLTVAEIMTREPYTLGAEDTVESARQIMAQHRIRHLPVVDGNSVLVGLISQRDVLAAMDSNVHQKGDDQKPQEHDLTVSAVMTTAVQTTEPGASLRGTAMYLQKHKVGCLPVLSKGKLLGIITDSDFVTVAINLMEQLELSEPEEALEED